MCLAVEPDVAASVDRVAAIQFHRPIRVSVAENPGGVINADRDKARLEDEARGLDCGHVIGARQMQAPAFGASIVVADTDARPRRGSDVDAVGDPPGAVLADVDGLGEVGFLAVAGHPRGVDRMA